MPQKTVQVELQQPNGFRTDCRAGKHTVVIDQPAAAGGTDMGPTPLEYQLIALGGCLAAIGRIIANQRKLPIRGFRVTVSGDINTDRLLGKPSTSRVGFTAIHASVAIDGDLSQEEKTKLLHEIDERCPISENLQNATPVRVTLVD
ncbi:MAG: OsmC family protein [Verrucomicrobiae bacterium]|nr:OsmC family protein [Verrucomicrobiae bacterium]